MAGDSPADARFNAGVVPKKAPAVHHSFFGSFAKAVHSAEHYVGKQYRATMASEHSRNKLWADQLHDAPSFAKDHGRPANVWQDWANATGMTAVAKKLRAGYRAADHVVSPAEKAAWSGLTAPIPNLVPKSVRQAPGYQFFLSNPNGLGGAAHELTDPLAAFLNRPSLATGAQAAAMFPWGTRMGAPKQWDMAGGGQVRRVGGRSLQMPGGPERSVHYMATRPSARQGISPEKVGESQMTLSPEETYVHWLHNQGDPSAATLIDLLAPAINRYRTKGTPIGADIANGKLAELALKMNRRNPGMFTPKTLAKAEAELESLKHYLAQNPGDTRFH